MIIMAVLSMAAAASQAHDAAAAAEKQQNAAEDQRKLDEKILAEQQVQADVKLNQVASERIVQAQVELGRLKSIAGESGLTGGTQAAILSQASGQANTDLATLERNRRGGQTQNDLEMLAAKQRERNRTASINTPSGLTTGLGVVSAGVSGYAGAGGTFGSSSGARPSSSRGGSGVG